jgi:hypothetical protein
LERINHRWAKKNLEQAARHFLKKGGATTKDAEQLAEAAEGLGIAIPVELLEKPSGPFLVWPENWDVVMMFWRLRRRWSFGPRGPVGIDAGAIQWLFSLCSVADPLAALDDLDIMQDAYLEELYS